MLVVEDEASLAKQLIAALHQAGYAVDHAGDGERADLLGQDERYDAVVLDLAARGRTTENAQAVTRRAAPERGCHPQASRAIGLPGDENPRHPA